VASSFALYADRQRTAGEEKDLAYVFDERNSKTNAIPMVAVRLPRHPTNEEVNRLMERSELVFDTLHRQHREDVDDDWAKEDFDVKGIRIENCQERDSVFANSYVDLGR